MSMEPRLVEVDFEEPPQTVPVLAETRRTLIRLKAPPQLKLRVVLRDFLGQPVASTPVAVELDGEPHSPEKKAVIDPRAARLRECASQRLAG